MLILNFIENTFKIELTSSGFILKDIHTNELYNKHQFDNFIVRVFGYYENDESETPIDVSKKWVSLNKRKYTGEIDDYLDNCKLVLGSTNWILYDKYKNIISLPTLHNLFGDQFNRDFITKHYSNWYDDKICEVSERIMNSMI